MKWILRDLKSSSYMSLCYGGTDVQLLGYVDSDFAVDVDNWRSTTGHVFTLGSGAVSWVSRLQKIVVLSTTRGRVCYSNRSLQGADMAERLFLKEIGKEHEAPSLHTNSQSAIDIANNPIYHVRAKHIDARYHFIRKMLKDGVFFC